jgi:CRP/FNR family transcriptional regulator
VGETLVTRPTRSNACQQAHCDRCAVRASVLFAGVDDTHVKLIESGISEYTCAPNTNLYHVGERGEALYTIRSGLLKLVQYLPDGTQRIVRLVSGTESAGLEALLDLPYQHDAIVVQAAEVCRIPVSGVRQLNRDNPQLMQELMRRWQRALTEADAWLTELSTGAARQRVARLLLRLSDADGQGRCMLFSRKDMGAMLGVTTESASRVTAELKREGVLDEGPWGFRVVPEPLRRIAAD